MEEELSEIEGYQISICPVERREERLDLNRYLIANAEATFFLRFCDDSMNGVGIFDGDIVVVDRSMKVGHGSVVVIWMDGSFRIRRLVRKGERIEKKELDYPLFEVGDIEGFEVWGGVTSIIRKLI